MEKINIKEIFGTNVFNNKVIKDRLPESVYKEYKKTVAENKSLDINVANHIANAMKEWAMEKGATHYTHWFQPMTGVTAEKHDSFIEVSSDGQVIIKFTGKSLVKGEPDASSFPNGGLRSTFEARGYTAWDPSSYAFVKDNSLYIPTIFCSYGGEALDKKTPLLRSMDALSDQAVRIMHILGKTEVKRVTANVGAEQEYFLIDKKAYEKRLDLMNCGRTLFGAKPSKGQELDDHYFGKIKSRVAEFMMDLDIELWKHGIYCKTKHNEVAPAQHELAEIYTTVNIATDHNQLTMSILKDVANKHDMVCLLHEKPFGGVNGSGKHNNWSMSTDTGVNLLDPTDNPHDNLQFLLFLTAVIKAVDEYQDMLRISVATAGNDHRLGANEAPPAILSIFLGEELAEVLEAIENDEEYASKSKIKMQMGASILPRFTKDKTDRNRTSPFAFTGNKFEFRMVGSNSSVAGPNIIINTIVAEELKQFADKLTGTTDVQKDVITLVKDVLAKHKRIIFNGNNYSEEWLVEAEKRGLLNLKTTADALPYYINEKNVNLFTSHKVFSESEVHSRYEILLESYFKTIDIEAKTMIEMVNHDIIPCVVEYQTTLAKSIKVKNEVAIPSVVSTLEISLLTKISDLATKIYNLNNKLIYALDNASMLKDTLEIAKYYDSVILLAMEDLRNAVDSVETLIGKKYWSMPTYSQILTSVLY